MCITICGNCIKNISWGFDKRRWLRYGIPIWQGLMNFEQEVNGPYIPTLVVEYTTIVKNIRILFTQCKLIPHKSLRKT